MNAGSRINQHLWVVAEDGGGYRQCGMCLGRLAVPVFADSIEVHVAACVWIGQVWNSCILMLTLASVSSNSIKYRVI